jgi:hypothetical protein
MRSRTSLEGNLLIQSLFFMEKHKKANLCD